MFLLFEARPAIIIYVGAIFLASAGFLGLWMVIDYLRLDTDVLVVAAAGWALAMGLIVFAGGDPVIDVLLALVVVSLAGAIGGALLLLTIRRYA